MPPNHQSGPQQQESQTSSAQLDARIYKFMLDMDARLDIKFKDARDQNREDFNNMLKAEVLPVLREMNKRLEQGDTRFTEHGERLDDHSDRLSKPQEDSGDTAALTKKSKGGWVSVDRLQTLVVGIISAVVAGAVSIIIAMKAMPTAMPAPPAPSTVSQPGTPP